MATMGAMGVNGGNGGNGDNGKVIPIVRPEAGAYIGNEAIVHSLSQIAYKTGSVTCGLQIHIPIITKQETFG